MSIPRNPFAILEGSELSAQHAASSPTHNTLDARHSRHKYQYISYGRQTVRQESHKQRHSPLWQPQAEDAIGPSFPSALATARIIEDIESVQYPEGIMGPKWNLNANTKNSKFKYDRDFLLQFMPVCKEKPDRLPPLDAIGLQPHYPLGLGIGNFPKPGSSSSIGKFATTGVTGKSSEERFAVANRAASVGRRGGMGGAAAVMGTKTRSINRESTEWAERKVETLLTMLTWQNFDSISDQIIRWANRSETEKDGRTLIQVIRQVFKQATAEEAWSGMYAHLCRKMMEKISASVQDDGIKNNEGKPIAGGQLFLEYLVKRCHEEFERGWATKDVAADVTATKAGEDETIRAIDDMIKDGGDEPYSEEYYAASKARHQGLGLIKFIGELFKMQMLTERIMHECLKKLLANVEYPEEEGIESLCMLLQIVGVFLDTSRARARMDVCFSRMKELARSGTVTSRMQNMLQDVIELRDRKWKTLDVVAAPNLAAVHDAANRVRAAAERESSRRGGVRGQYDQQGPDGWTVTGESGGRGTPRPPPKAGDLSNFGTINKAPMTFGPTSVFAKGKEGTKGPRMAAHSRPILSWDALSRLSRNSEIAADARGPKPTSSRPASRKTDFDQDSMEFFSVRDLDEAEHYFQKLTPEHRCRLVDKLVKTAIESKAADAQLVGNFFARAHSKKLCSEASFAAGFMPTAELLDDIVIDAPKAFDLMAIMMKGASLSEDARDRIAAKSVDSDKLLALTAGSRRGNNRGPYDRRGPDGWTVTSENGGRGTPRPPPKAGDLSNFGKINQAAPMTFGPTSVFTKEREDAKGPRTEPISRSSSSSNMFSMLSQNSEIAADTSGPKPTTGRSANRKTSIDLGTAGVPEAPLQRRKLQLLPRSKMTEDGGDGTAASTPVSENGEVEESGTAADSMSEADAKKHLDQDSKEFFAVRNLDEAEEYFQKLTPEHRFRLADKPVNTAMESKAADAQLVSDFFAQAHSKDLCSEASFEEGFKPIAELLDDIAIDAPKAFDLMAVMVKGASLSEDARGRIAAKSVYSEKLLALLST